MSKPRLLLVLTEFPPRIGGMQTHAFYLSRHLADRGYPIEVVTYRPGTEQERMALFDVDHQLSFPVRRVLSRLGHWHNVELLVQEAARFGPDLVYCSTVFFGDLRQRLGVPVLSRSVGNDVMRPWIAYPFRWGSRLLSTPALDDRLYRFFRNLHYPEWVEMIFRRQRRRLMERSARQLDRVIANSEFTAELLSDIGVNQERVEVLVGGVDAARFAYHSGDREAGRDSLRRELGLEGKFVLATACRLVAKKGIDFLLPAFKRLLELIPEARLLVIGEGRHGRRYRRQAAELQLNGAVNFLGSVDQRTIHRYYWASDLFVLASRVQVDPRTGLRDAETMGRVLCEANAAGVPVVAASSGGIPSVIQQGKNGLLFSADDTDDFIRQVSRLREDGALSRELVAEGRRRAERSFDWRVIVDAHEQMMNRALQGRPA